MSKKPSAIHMLCDLEHDMKTCGFNSYGVKKSTYYNWCNRIERIRRQFQMEREELPAPVVSSQAPPPPPQ